MDIKNLMSFMDANPGREYYIVWVSDSMVTFNYSHPIDSPIHDIGAYKGTFKIGNIVRFLHGAVNEGFTVRIKAGNAIRPPLPTNPTDKIYNVVISTSISNYDDIDAEVVLVEAVRLNNGTWSGYTADGYAYTIIDPSAIKNFRTTPPGK